MSIEQFKNRNISDDYFLVDIDDYPTTNLGKFTRVIKRTFKAELLVGLWVVMREMFKFNIRYRAVHEMKRLWESGTERCIGCGLCEKICISDCIRMETKIDEESRKEVSEYSHGYVKSRSTKRI